MIVIPGISELVSVLYIDTWYVCCDVLCSCWLFMFIGIMLGISVMFSVITFSAIVGKFCVGLSALHLCCVHTKTLQD